jgi:hypothetical protein
MFISHSLDLLTEYGNVLNFVCSSVIFIGGFYVALNPGKRPHWIVTLFWYACAASLFNALTLGAEWVYGQEYELSYYQIGDFTESLFKIFISIITVGILIESKLFKRDASLSKAGSDESPELSYWGMIKSLFSKKG